jgi:hypothetical protein
MGLIVSGFPNLLTVAGPQSPSASVNYPRGIETHVDWATDLLGYMSKHGYLRVEAPPEAEQDWGQQVAEVNKIMLMQKGRGWFTGYNSNVAGHEAPRVGNLVYSGGAPKYRKLIDQVADNEYEGLILG